MSIQGWTTDDELEYLQTIGEASELCRGMTRLEILLHYKNAFNKRSQWDHIDRTTVLKELVKMIKAERRHA